MPWTNRLLEKLGRSETSLGLYVNSPDMVELCGYLGFDWVMIDQMFTANDWGRTEELIRAGQASDITPVVRVQSNPWVGYDHRVAVDVTRALGVGAQFVLVSHSGNKELSECMAVTGDWHKKAMTIHPYGDFADWDRVRDQQERTTFVIPQPETRDALDGLEEAITTLGVKAVFIAMTDASRIITGQHEPDWYDERLWDFVNRIVALGAEHGVYVGANTSYAYTMEEMTRRVELLIERGVKMIMVQGAPFLFQVAMTEFLRRLAPALGRSTGAAHGSS